MPVQCTHKHHNGELFMKKEKAADIFFRLSDPNLTPPLKVSKSRRISVYFSNSQDKHNDFQIVRSLQPAPTRYHVSRIVSRQTKLSTLPYTSGTSLHLWTSKYKINNTEDRQEIWFLNTRQSVNGCADIGTCAFWQHLALVYETRMLFEFSVSVRSWSDANSRRT